MSAEVVALLVAGAVASVGAAAAAGPWWMPTNRDLPRTADGVSGEVSARPDHGLRARLARLRVRGRADIVQGQLADAVSAIAAGSRAGLSLPQAIELAAGQVSDPVGGSLRAVVDRVRLGESLEDALGGWVLGGPVPDVRLAAAVLRLHRRTGGALAPVLEGLARTLRERRAAVGEVRSLTAQARLSGAILGLLPIGFFLFLWITSRRDMTVALGSSFGRTAIALGLLLEAGAFLWIRRLLRVEA